MVLGLFEKKQDSPPTQTVINNPNFGANQDPAKYQYHEKVESFSEDLLAFLARVEGKSISYDNEGNCFLKEVKDKDDHPIKPFCNSLGRHELYSFMSMRLKPTMPLTNIDLKRFYELMKDDHKKLSITCYLNAEDWELDEDRWEEIHFSMLDMIENARRRGIDNQERDWINKMLNIMQTITGEKGKPSGGLEGMFNKGGKT